MGFFSSLFRRVPKTTKLKVAGHAASTIDFVISDMGVGALVAGNIALDKEFRPIFQSGNVATGGNILAVVAIGDLEEAEIFKTLAHVELHDLSLISPFVDVLVYAILRKFDAQCPAFAKLQM